MKPRRTLLHFRTGLLVALFILITAVRAAVFTQEESTVFLWDFGMGDERGLIDKKAGLALKPSMPAAALQWVDGHHGKALVFPGDLKLQSAKSSALRPSVGNGITVECWLRIDSAPAKTFGLVENMNYAKKTGYRLSLTADRRARWAVLDSSAENAGQSKAAIPPGVWTHVAATYDGEEACIYIDGKLESRKPLAGGVLDAPGQPLVVGFYTDSIGQSFFKGEIEGLRFSGTAKTFFPLK